MDERLRQKAEARKMAAAGGFEKYREKKGRQQRANICPSCKTEVKSGSVFIGLREKVTGKGADKTLASQSVALCEACCCNIYEALHKRFDAAISD